VTGTLFFGYASRPEVNRETLHTATKEIASSGVISAVSWEDLGVSGRFVVKRIVEAIDQASACAFDITTLNENVLFELGYAIARAKPVWILLDQTDVEAKQRWHQFQLLKSVGYVGWSNAEEIKANFLSRRPDLDDKTLYDDLIEPDLGVHVPASLFYLPAFHNTEPARLIDRRLKLEQARGVRLTLADPTESALNPLPWYASKVYESDCTLVHFEAPRRELATLHNARSALVAGLARGLDRQVLMLAEEDYSAPLDYEDLLRVYRSARECEAVVDSWLREVNLEPRGGSRTPRVRLAAELRTLRFGEHVAENELDTLSDYFLATASFEDVIADRNALYVGRKGTGKTANMLQAAARLSEDARNLVVVIKPASYEFSSLLALLGSLPVSLQQYSIQALWKFLLTSEIANRVLDVLESRAPGIPYTEQERRLLDYVESAGFGLREDFGARFERTVQSISGLVQNRHSEAAGRDFLTEALHAQAIGRLRSLLGPVLKSKKRVAVLIDNLDKGWERSANLDLLAQLLLGLLAAVGRVKVDFAKEDYWRERVSLTVATFLRSDIYGHVMAQAREPDKMPASVVTWDDPETLLRVVEERFLAARPDGTEPGELWARFFAPTIREHDTRSYVVSRVLPRPRDLIYLCNAAASAAANRGHQRIEADDLLAGELTYSQFAFESLLVENGITITLFSQVLLEFLGEPVIMDGARIRALIAQAGVDEAVVDGVFERLRDVSFLGLETGEGRFEFPGGGHSASRADVLARKLAEERESAVRYTVHPAFRSYLEMKEDGRG
jgi:hypothetical protein